MIQNTIFAKNREGKKASVCSLGFPSIELVELAGNTGFDAVHLDGEHGAFDLLEIDRLIGLANALGMSVTARIPNTRFDTITQWLDRGIQGIMAPHVETPEQAVELVDACYFPPLGHRSWGTWRGTLYNDEHAVADFGGRRAFMDYANEHIWVYAQIESKLGYENLDAILAVDGLHAIAFGPFDLGTSLGFSGEGAGHPEIDRVQSDIIERTHAAGKRINTEYVTSFQVGGTMSTAMRAFITDRKDVAFE